MTVDTDVVGRVERLACVHAQDGGCYLRRSDAIRSPYRAQRQQHTQRERFHDGFKCYLGLGRGREKVSQLRWVGIVATPSFFSSFFLSLLLLVFKLKKIKVSK